MAKGGGEILGIKAGPLGKGAAAIFVLVGLGLGFLAWDSNRFRVTDVHLRSVNTYVGPCPGDQIFEGLITTKGGDGEVTYRLFSEGGLQITAGVEGGRERRVIRIRDPRAGRECVVLSKTREVVTKPS